MRRRLEASDRAEQLRLTSTFGAVLRVERGGAGMTQQRLADAAGLDRRTVDRLECGARRPSTGVDLAHRQGAAASRDVHAARRGGA